MKAARLHENAKALRIEEIADPKARPGSVVVRIEAAFASHFIGKLIDGSGGYMTPPRPFTPGMDAIGIVEAVPSGVHGIELGERVFCDSYFEPGQRIAPAGRVFIGNFSMGPDSVPLLAEWPDGAYAEKMCLPAECLTPVRGTEEFSAGILCRLGWFGTAYGAFERGGMRPGAVVAVNGATGLLGSSAVLLALALGASRVFALGRSADRLAPLAGLDSRVEIVTDPAALPPLDLAVSSIDGSDASSVEALVARLARRGALVLIGAPNAPMALRPGMLLRSELAILGSLWFGRHAVPTLVRLIAAGLLDLSAVRAEEYPLDDINTALAAAAHRPNPLHHVAIRCR